MKKSLDDPECVHKSQKKNKTKKNKNVAPVVQASLIVPMSTPVVLLQLNRTHFMWKIQQTRHHGLHVDAKLCFSSAN